MNKTLKSRISLIYLCLAGMMALIGAVSVFNLLRLSNSINSLMIANYKSIKAINNMRAVVEQQNQAVLLYIRFDSRKGIDSFVKNQNIFNQSYNIESNNITEPGEAALVEQLNKEYLNFIRSFAELQEIKNREGAEKAYLYFNSQIQPKVRRIKDNLVTLSNLNEKAMFSSKVKATSIAGSSMKITLFISLLAVIGGIIVSMILINRFFKPIYDLKETVKLVQAGDLNRQARIVYYDEIGELAGEFNNMTNRLLQYEQSTIGRLMEEKNRSLAIVKSISDPLIVLDANYRILLMNSAAEEFFEVEEGQAQKKHFLEVIRNGELFEHITSVFSSGWENDQNNVVRVSAKGKDYYFNVIIRLAPVADNDVGSMVILFQNITRIKQLEKVKIDFTATVSHEFKTPLTSMMMGLSLLMDEKIGALNEKQQETIRTVREDGETLATLVQNLLEIATIESDKSVFRIQPCSVIGLIENSVKKFLEQAEREEVTLCYDIEENLPKVKADVEKITWVLNNLITNALKYTNAGDEIRVGAFVKQDKMCITIKDTGIGIPAEYLNRLFEKFVQVKGYDLEVRGTGLGLAIAKEIVEAHGGEIWCESRLDAGSVFTFTLPLAKGDEDHETSTRG
jgi:PAS domain S-box-containing protein